MEIINIIKEQKNPLFRRKEIELNLRADIAPSKEEVIKTVSHKFSCKPEEVRINRIMGKYGSKIFLVTANIYDSEKHLKETEHFSKKEKEKMNKKEESQEVAA
jgi:ribosomal protein S24E